MPDDGRVLVHGKDTSGVDPIELRRNIGYAIQGSVLFPHLTVEQNIAYVPSLLNRRDQRRTESAVDKWIGLLGLPSNLRDRYPAELSGGQGPARRNRPRAGSQPRHPAGGRAFQRRGCYHTRKLAGRNQAHPQPDRRHHPVRHAR